MPAPDFNMDDIRALADGIAEPPPTTASVAAPVVAPAEDKPILIVRADKAIVGVLVSAISTAIDEVADPAPWYPPVTIADVGEALEHAFINFSASITIGKAEGGDPRGANINRIAVLAQIDRMKATVAGWQLPEVGL